VKTLILGMALFISVKNGIVQERTIIRSGHKITASVVSYRARTFEPVEKYQVDVKQIHGKLTQIDWDKKK